MSGTLFGLPLSQQLTSLGRPMSGAKLYIYAANTTTPATSYQDFGLTSGLELPFPIVADADGRIPQFWLADGSYRARLTDSSGVVKFDLPEVQALGASSGSGSSTATDPNAIFATGDVLWLPKSGTKSGWVRHNARTIGSASSGATERANADCEALFLYLWGAHSDTLCPVTGGRGLTAAADWAANKPMGTLDLRGRSPVGLDDMGNSSASRLNGVTFSVGDATTAASLGGAALHTLTIAQLAAHDHGGVTGDTQSSVAWNSADRTTTGQPTVQVINPDGANSALTPEHHHTVASQGGGAAHNNMQPFALGTWYVRL